MYRIKTAELAKTFKTDVANGLKASVCQERLKKEGPNTLVSQPKQNIIITFFKQFKDILVIILIVAAIISAVIDPTDLLDSIIIGVVLLINSLIGTIQEMKAEKTLNSLKKMTTLECQVKRDGKFMMIPSVEVTTGDIVYLKAGNYVSADIRLIDANELYVDESSLTGEAIHVLKTPDDILVANQALGDQTNMLFSATFITKGNGYGVVVATGMNTEIGRIASLISNAKARATPLQKKLTQIGKIVGLVAIAICAIVFILEVASGEEMLYSFKTSVALAVAAIPEGLATVVTVVLAIGVMNMAKENAIVKKLPAVETLGCTNIVCSDKTGTLTQNKMHVVAVYNNGLQDLDNLTYEAKRMIHYGYLASNAVKTDDSYSGDATEVALANFFHSFKYKNPDFHRRVKEYPFDSRIKMMSTVYLMKGKYIAITKGAYDIMEKNACFPKDLRELEKHNNELAKKAYRVIAIGIKGLTDKDDPDYAKDIYILGLVGLADPPRENIDESIKIASNASIRTIMLTGDHLETAKAVGIELGILTGYTKAITSSELQALSDEYFLKHVAEYSVYARVTPADKVRIVKTWKALGCVVAMTGDGINDAPALKEADIGCAMGSGTDVAKEAADMILLDDNYETIISAVRNGRNIYENIRKCCKYLLSSNIGEVLTIFLSSLFSTIFSVSLGVPLAPTHLLWINVITDSLPAFGLGMEKNDFEVMEKPPRDTNEHFFAHGMGKEIVFIGIYIGCITLLAYSFGLRQSHIVGSSMAFYTISLSQLLHAYNCKSEGSVFRLRTLNNKALNISFLVGCALIFCVIYIPQLQLLFKLTPLRIIDLAWLTLLAFSIIIYSEIYKRFNRMKNPMYAFYMR